MRRAGLANPQAYSIMSCSLSDNPAIGDAGAQVLLNALELNTDSTLLELG